MLVLSMKMPCWRDLEAYGARDVLNREYADMLMATPESGHDVSLKIDIERLSTDPGGELASNGTGTPSNYLTRANMLAAAERETIIRNLALLKRNAMAAPYERAFAAQKEGTDSPMMVVRYRENEAIYIKGLPDRVTVVFSTEFEEEEDRIFGKVFLQVGNIVTT